MKYNKQNTPRRKNSNDKAYEDGWDRIFNKDRKIVETDEKVAQKSNN